MGELGYQLCIFSYSAQSSSTQFCHHPKSKSKQQPALAKLRSSLPREVIRLYLCEDLLFSWEREMQLLGKHSLCEMLKRRHRTSCTRFQNSYSRLGHSAQWEGLMPDRREKSMHRQHFWEGKPSVEKMHYGLRRCSEYFTFSSLCRAG